MASLLRRKLLQNPTTLRALFSRPKGLPANPSPFLNSQSILFPIPNSFSPDPKTKSSSPSPGFLNPKFYPKSTKYQGFQESQWLIPRFSSSSPEKPDSGDSQKPPETPDFKHQEIESPTVERDLSNLADETRQSLDGLRKSVYDLSSSLALLGVANLTVGAAIIYFLQPNGVFAVQGLVAFAFPFSVAFVMRRSLKPMAFFRKVEEQGRLQLLTLCLQVSKTLNLLFLRIRVVSLGCVAGLVAGSLVTLWPQWKLYGFQRSYFCSILLWFRWYLHAYLNFLWTNVVLCFWFWDWTLFAFYKSSCYVSWLLVHCCLCILFPLVLVLCVSVFSGLGLWITSELSKLLQWELIACILPRYWFCSIWLCLHCGLG